MKTFNSTNFVAVCILSILFSSALSAQIIFNPDPFLLPHTASFDRKVIASAGKECKNDAFLVFVGK